MGGVVVVGVVFVVYCVWYCGVGGDWFVDG